MARIRSSSEVRPHTIAHSTSKQRFLKALARVGTISAACEAARVGRRTVYDWRAADPDFDAQLNEAKDDLADRLEAEAVKRATIGKSDDLLKFLLKGLRPERYGARVSGVTSVQQNTLVEHRCSCQCREQSVSVKISEQRQAELEWLDRIARGEQMP